MSNLLIKEKGQHKSVLNHNHNFKNNSLAQYGNLNKRKKIKINSYNINMHKLLLNKNNLLIENQEENINDNDIIIKSNNFIARKNENNIPSEKKTKKNKNILKINNLETNNELLDNNILLDFKLENERIGNEDMFMKGFVRKVDYDLNNLINKKSNKKRAKTAKIINNRIDKSINVMENSLNKYIKERNSIMNNNINNDNIYNIDINNFKSLNNDNTESNVEETIKKNHYKKNNIKNIFGDIDHKVIFMDKKNNIISKNNTINLLKEEEDLIFKKLKSDYKMKGFSKFIKNKDGKKVILPILFKNIIKRNDDINSLDKESNSPFKTSLEKESNYINNIYYILETKQKSSKLKANNVFITNYSNKRKLKLNQDVFNRRITINKKENNENTQKRKNSSFYKNLYFNFNSKYPYTDTNGIEIVDNSDKDNRPMTERNNKHKYKSLFKNKFKKDYRDCVNNTYKYKNNKKSNKQGNIKENKISDSFDKNKLIIKSTKKVIKDKKEQNLNSSDKKNIKENKEKNYVIKKETNKNKSYKLKNRDLLKINQSFKSNSRYKKDSYIEESIDNQKNSKNDINSDKKKSNILDNKKKMNISDISKTDSKDEETTNENKKKINPKKMSLLIDHIKKNTRKRKKKRGNKS